MAIKENLIKQVLVQAVELMQDVFGISHARIQQAVSEDGMDNLINKILRNDSI